jgi:carboxymethylenebutenolidase
MNTETVTLTASDGHQLSAYVAHPEGKPKAGLLVLQEIFGVNEHIRNVADGFAADGYLVVTPAMFDRVKPGIELGYDNFEAARETMAELELENCVKDMAAAADYARSAGKVGIVGYCWGGAMADLAACHGLVDAAVSYYGRMTVEWLDKQPQCPVLYHYGERDPLIPSQTIEQIARKRDGKVRVWGGAGHGFNCDERPEFHKHSATQARLLTLEHFAKHLL